MKYRYFFALVFLFLSWLATANESDELVKFCEQSVKKLPGPIPSDERLALCKTARMSESCKSEEGSPIFHFDHPGQDKKGKKILVFSLVHGDEPTSGSVAVLWAQRLLRLESSRNAWRIVPILNPDGWSKSTRTNSRGVDINRNFPTVDWDYAALTYWEKVEKKNPRRYPGKEADSERETKCAIQHIRDFSPDMIVAIHTPYGILDFDGPQLSFMNFKGLPWQQLGHFPGSLGRYMWYDHGVPVLTIELKNEDDLKNHASLIRLQDLSGSVAIKSADFLQKSVFKKK